MEHRPGPDRCIGPSCRSARRAAGRIVPRRRPARPA